MALGMLGLFFLVHLGYDRFRSQVSRVCPLVWSPSNQTFGLWEKSIYLPSPEPIVAVSIITIIAPLSIAKSIWNRQLVQPEMSAGATACHLNDTKFPEIGSPLSSVPIRNFTPVFRSSDL